MHTRTYYVGIYILFLQKDLYQKFIAIKKLFNARNAGKGGLLISASVNS